MITYHDIGQRTEEWHQLRGGRFTSSQIAKLFSKETTLEFQNCIRQIVSERMIGDVVKEDSYDNQYMKWGREHEDEARERFEQETFIKVDKSGFFVYQNICGCSPDGLIDDDGLIEIKCPKATTQVKYLEENKFPAEYKYQVHSQMLFSGRSYCYFVSYHPQLPLFIKHVEKDDLIQQEIIDKVNYCNKLVEQKLKLISKL